MQKTKDGLLGPILPRINHARDNEKATSADIFVERHHRAAGVSRVREMEREVREMGFKVLDQKSLSPNAG